MSTMILEYLTKDKQIEKITEKEFSAVHHEYYQLNGNDSWISLFSHESNSEDSAILLSKLNIKIMENHSPTVLTNESSQYFNKRLFPLLNDFERKLRKLLYLYISINPSLEGTERIKDLEKLDFATIFKHLFTDELFYKHLKKQITDVANKLTKKEIIDMIAEMEENCLWGKLIGNDRVSNLVKQPSLVRSMRNSVMHAHNIDHTEYKKSKKLYEKINQELDTEIGALTGKEHVNEHDMETAIQLSNSLSEMLETGRSYDDFLPKETLIPLLLSLGTHVTDIETSLKAKSLLLHQQQENAKADMMDTLEDQHRHYIKGVI